MSHAAASPFVVKTFGYMKSVQVVTTGDPLVPTHSFRFHCVCVRSRCSWQIGFWDCSATYFFSCKSRNGSPKLKQTGEKLWIKNDTNQIKIFETKNYWNRVLEHIFGDLRNIVKELFGKAIVMQISLFRFNKVLSKFKYLYLHC